jgi:hypothetical protein
MAGKTGKKLTSLASNFISDPDRMIWMGDWTKKTISIFYPTCTIILLQVSAAVLSNHFMHSSVEDIVDDSYCILTIVVLAHEDILICSCTMVKHHIIRYSWFVPWKNVSAYTLCVTYHTYRVWLVGCMPPSACSALRLVSVGALPPSHWSLSTGVW